MALKLRRRAVIVTNGILPQTTGADSFKRVLGGTSRSASANIAHGFRNGNARGRRSLANIRLLLSMRFLRSLTSCSRSSLIWFFAARNCRSAGLDPGLARAVSIAFSAALIVLIFVALTWRSLTKRARMRLPMLACKFRNTFLVLRSMLTIDATLG